MRLGTRPIIRIQSSTRFLSRFAALPIHTLQEKIHNDNGSIIPVYRNYVDAVDERVKGLVYVPLNNFGGAESPVTMWLDS